MNAAISLQFVDTNILIYAHDTSAGAKNRLYSEEDIKRVRRIQRLTQEMGVNLAGVELILRLLDEMDEVKRDLDKQLTEYVLEAERRIQTLMANPNMPLRKDETLLPVPNIRIGRKIDL